MQIAEIRDGLLYLWTARAAAWGGPGKTFVIGLG